MDYTVNEARLNSLVKKTGVMSKHGRSKFREDSLGIGLRTSGMRMRVRLAKNSTSMTMMMSWEGSAANHRIEFRKGQNLFSLLTKHISKFEYSAFEYAVKRKSIEYNVSKKRKN